MCIHTDTLYPLPRTSHKVATRYLYPKQKHESSPIHPLNAPCELKVDTKAPLKPFMIILTARIQKRLSQMFQKHMHVLSETTIWKVPRFKVCVPFNCPLEISCTSTRIYSIHTVFFLDKRTY